MSTTTANGLELVYLGEFLNDPAADTVQDLAQDFNFNFQLLDTTMSAVASIQPVITVIQNTGITSGFIYGGSF